MNLLQAMVFGIIQGLTEFLPVSSSAHLDLYGALSGAVFAPDQQVAYFAILHLGSLAAVLVLFWRDVGQLARAVPGTVRKVLTGRWGLFRLYEKLLCMLAVATVPAGLVGVLFEKQIEAAFNSITMIGFCLVLTGIVLWLTRYIPTGTTGVAGMGIAKALAVGLAQALAILPGLSRSGMTISAALFMGIDREIAARFSFLLSLPVVAGAGLLKLAKIDWSAATSDF
ncbi:MAG TPA: undecaprenyl-diphosphate phosphatase, partial [bacterium]|nr:undecaprenyl-diphosphate phosphatase [bacterium]